MEQPEGVRVAAGCGGESVVMKCSLRGPPGQALQGLSGHCLGSGCCSKGNRKPLMSYQLGDGEI